jgi:hypothetical protein
LETGSSGGGRKLWSRSKALGKVSEALEEVRLGGSKHEALEAVEGSGGGRRFWRRSQRLWKRSSLGGSKHEALEAVDGCVPGCGCGGIETSTLGDLLICRRLCVYAHMWTWRYGRV